MTGIVLTTLAVVLRILSNPVANVFQKQLTAKGHNPLLVNFLTYFILSVICIFIAFTVDWLELPPQFWYYSVLVGMAGGIGNAFLVKALQRGELSVLGPINSYKSIVGMIIGVVLLREIPNVWGFLGMALIIYGSYFVLETTEDKFSWRLLQRKEIQFRIWAMILTAIEAVLIKKVIIVSSTLASFISWCWFGAVFSLFLLLIYRVDFKTQISRVKMSGLNRYFYLVICIGTMQFTTTYAFENMHVGYALSLFQLSTIISVVLGHKVFKEQDIRKKLIGSIIMILGSVIIILLKDK